MPPKIIIVKPDITEEERQKVFDGINQVLSEIAHACSRKIKSEKIAL